MHDTITVGASFQVACPFTLQFDPITGVELLMAVAGHRARELAEVCSQLVAGDFPVVVVRVRGVGRFQAVPVAWPRSGDGAFCFHEGYAPDDYVRLDWTTAARIPVGQA